MSEIAPARAVTRLPLPTAAEKPDLIVDPGDLPATARELRDLLASSGRLFDRGVPVKVVAPADGGIPTTTAGSRQQCN